MTRKACIALCCVFRSRARLRATGASASNGERLGAVHFETTCSAPAQKAFDHAMALLHSFEFAEAMEGSTPR